MLSYHGLDAKLRRTTLTFDPPPQRLAVDSASYDLALDPNETRPIFLAVSCDPAATRPLPFLRGLIAARRELRRAARDRASVETSNERFNEMLCRSAADLAILMTETPEGRYPYAGIPWFSTTFGRDGRCVGARATQKEQKRLFHFGAEAGEFIRPKRWHATKFILFLFVALTSTQSRQH